MRHQHESWIPDPVVPFAMLAIDGEPRYFVVVSEWMDGAKQAVRYGKTLCVSPAMWKLLIHAETQEEMQTVWDAIPKAGLEGNGGAPSGRRVRAAWESPDWMNGVPAVQPAGAGTAEGVCS